MRQAFKASDVPNGPHTAALLFETKHESYWQPEWTPRPGSGGGSYESHEVKAVEYWFSENEKDLCDWLKGIKLEGLTRKTYVLLRVAGQLTAEVSVFLSPQPTGPDPNNHDYTALGR
jgi:hypothetical protein